MDQGPDPVAYLLNFGVLGLLLVLWLTGVVVGKREYERALSGEAEWKRQYERESEAHEVTRQALARERERQDASTEAGRTAAALLSVLGHTALPGGPT